MAPGGPIHQKDFHPFKKRIIMRLRGEEPCLKIDRTIGKPIVASAFKAIVL